MVIYNLPELKHMEGQQYIIYGTGEAAKQYCSQLRNKFGYESVPFFIESDPIKKEFLGVPIYNPDELLQFDYKKYKYIVTSFASMNIMIDTLVSKGVECDQIIKASKAITNIHISDELDTIESICYYPEVTSKEKLTDIYKRIKWYIPHNQENRSKISIFADIAEEEQLSNAHLVSDQNMNELLNSCDMILVWDKNSLNDIALKGHASKVYCVDETFYSTVESSIYRKIYFQCLLPSQKKHYHSLSISNFEKMYSNNKGKDIAYVFGTGPSIENAYKFDFSNGFNIVCNSIVKNKDLLRKIQPDLLVFADPVFHFSPCEYAQKFREDVLETVGEFDCYCLVPDFTMPLLIAHYPELTNRIIGMTLKNNMNFPSSENFYVKSSANILTLYMIPVASSICDQINILGCDGRQSNETYFWKHNEETQYSDLMKTVFDMHPSFFRDRVYEDYYKEHCKYLEHLIQYGESFGKKYQCLTPTYIPPLKERSAKL